VAHFDLEKTHIKSRIGAILRWN